MENYIISKEQLTEMLTGFVLSYIQDYIGETAADERMIPVSIDAHNFLTMLENQNKLTVQD